jgi:hypothetical protein
MFQLLSEKLSSIEDIALILTADIGTVHVEDLRVLLTFLRSAQRANVDEIEAAKASNFNKEQKISAGASQIIQCQSLRNRKLQIEFNTRSHLV